MSSSKVYVFDPLSADLPVGAWQTLSGSALDPNPFFSASFLQSFLTNMGGKGVKIVALRHEATGNWLVAAPVGRRPAGLAVPVSTVWTTDYAPLGTPLLHPDASDTDIGLFFKKAAGTPGVLAFPFLPLASQTAQRLLGLKGVQASVALRTERAGHAAGAEGECQLETAFKGKRRKEMRRLLRRLEDHGPVHFQSITGSEAVPVFEEFLKLEASGWKGQESTALQSKPETAAFSRNAIAACAQLDRVRIDTLRADDRLVAALVSFVDRGHVFSWKIAFDESFARYSPGGQLVLQAFRENLAMPGFKQADSLAVPGHSMIEPLWRGRLETGTLFLVGPPFSSLKRGLCIADLAAERKLRQAARGIKKQLKG